MTKETGVASFCIDNSYSALPEFQALKQGLCTSDSIQSILLSNNKETVALLFYIQEN